MATAFYIDYPRITAVEVSGSARKPKLKRVVVGDLPEPRNDDGTPIADKQAYLNEQIGAFIKEHKLMGGKQFLLVSPEAMRFRDMKLAFTERRQIDKVIEFQVEGVIPNMPIDELKVGYNILIAEPDGARILVHAAEKKYIRERLIALEEAGCSIDGVDSHLSGTLNLGLLHPDLGKEAPPALWIDFAGSTATVTIVSGADTQATRVFVAPYLARSGAEKTQDEARAVAEDAERRYDEFHDVVVEDDEEPALPAADSVNIGEVEIADRIRHMSRDELEKFVHRVAVEARRTMMMSQFDVEPVRLVVSGLGEAGRQIAEMTGTELGLEEVKAIELMDIVNPPDDDGKRKVDMPDVGELSYLTGTALKGIGRDFTGIDFRYGDLSPGTLFDYAKTPLAFTATLVLLFSGIMFLISYTQAQHYEGDIAKLRDAGVKEHFQRAFQIAESSSEIKSASEITDARQKRDRTYPSMPDDPAGEIRNAHARLKSHQERLRGEADTNYAEPHPADEVLVAILETIEKANPSYDFALISCDVRERNVTIEYLASTRPEGPDARSGEQVNDTEASRIYSAFRDLVNERTNWFDGSIDETSSTPQAGPEGRQANRITLRMGLKEIESPRERNRGNERRRR